jgi:hypothetical protein
VISETDLHALADAPVPGAGVPPIERVLARGGRLRRRRRTARAVGLGAVVGGLAAGVLAVDRGAGSAGRTRIPPASATTAAPAETGLLPNPLSCLTGGSASFSAGDAIPRAEVPEAMRVVPTRTPDGVAISVARGRRYDFRPDGCGLVADMQDTLVLTATGADGTVSGTMDLQGPYSTSGGPTGVQGTTTTRVRGGREATFIDQPVTGYVYLEWREPDGSWWEMRGNGVPSATVRAVVGALRLDSTPAAGQPPARLPDGALPAGFTVTRQAATVPPPAPDRRGPMVSWVVQVGESKAVQTGLTCHLDVNQQVGDRSFLEDYRGRGDRPVDVGGREGLWGPVMGTPNPHRLMDLTWSLAPDLVARLDCERWSGPDAGTLPLDEMLDVARSVRTVAPDDPRLPADPEG